MRFKKLLLIPAIGVLAALAFASAAALTITPVSQLSAGDAGIASCDPAVTIDFHTAYDETAVAYVVDAVYVTDIDLSCDFISVTLTGVGGTELDTYTLGGLTGSATFTPIAIKVSELYDIHVLLRD